MYKSKLQVLCHQHSWCLPEYTAVKDGPDHNPKFRATVTVNGVQFQTPSDHFRSSKEAQNQAAKLAFDHFTTPVSFLSGSSPAPAKGSPLLNTNPNIGPGNTGVLQASLQPSVQTVNMNAAPVSSKEISHLYKNRLQIYAQKKNLVVPTYSYETDGPPHARRFKSTVTIEEKAYTSPDFYSTLKEAEHAAAKVALESLPCSETQEDDNLYKSLLQELTHIESFGAPIYETTKSGSPHMPTFVSVVGIIGESFQGQEAKTKKQAEMSAAKVAYKSLMDRRARRNLTHKSGTADESHVNVMRENQANEAKTSIVIQQRFCEEDKGSSRHQGDHTKRPGEVSHYKLKSSISDQSPPTPNVTSEPHPNSKAKNIFRQEKQTKEDAKTTSNSDSESEWHSHMKVIVCPQNPNSTYPGGSTILPCSDEKWVAMNVEINPSH